MSLPAPYYDRDGITVYCADNRDVLPHLGRFDLLLTDPPYGIGWSTPEGPTRTGGRSFDGDDKPFDPATTDGMCGKEIIWGGNYFELPRTNAWLVWDKRVTDWTNDQSDCEFAWTSLGMPARIFRKNWGGGGCAAKENGSGRGYIHPTQKPLALMQWCLSLVPDAQTVLDPFGGSLTTAVACKLAGIQCTIIEQSEAYCEVGVKRLRQGVLELTG